MGGPAGSRGLSGSDWPRGIGARAVQPRSLTEAIAIAFTAAVDEGYGVARNRQRGEWGPEGMTTREMHEDLASRLGIGRDAAANSYNGQRWLRPEEIEAALRDTLIGPPMQRRLLPDGSCDLQRLLLAYASAPGDSGPRGHRVRQAGVVPPNPSAGSARSRRGSQLTTTGRPHTPGVRDAIRAIMRDGKPRYPAAVKELLRSSFYGGSLDSRAVVSVDSALSQLAQGGELVKDGSGRYQRTESLKE